MICGALQTLNEEAFEDVPANELDPSVAEVIQEEQLSAYLTPIREGSERSVSMDSDLCVTALALNKSNHKLHFGVAASHPENPHAAAVNNMASLVELEHSPSCVRDQDDTIIVISECTPDDTAM